MFSALVSGLVAGYGVAIPVGAIGVLIISLSARTSWRVGAGAALGVAAADGLYAAAAVIAGAAVAGLIRPVATPLRLVAGIVLLLIAVRIGVTAWRHHRDPARTVRTPALSTAPRAFGALLGLTILNPATVVYFAALVLGRNAGVTSGVAAGTAFVVAVLAASASWQLLLAAGGTALGRSLGSPRGRLVTALVSSVIVAALAIKVLWG
ncbi:MAG TPA: LysE family transporter [Micromonosporaceae bacterium]|nr:LysE family transporter [Micromonosporaceae bacterium]